MVAWGPLNGVEYVNVHTPPFALEKIGDVVKEKIPLRYPGFKKIMASCD